MKHGIILCLLMGITSCSNVAMVDSKATIETKQLYKNLFSVAEKGTMFGHQDATLYGIGWKYVENESDVKKVTGDYPAVYGWELGHLEVGDEVSLDSIGFANIREGIQKAYSRGGVNTISWHLRNPLTGGSSWDSADNAVHAILNDKDVAAKYREWLDRIASFMSSLTDAEGRLIPVLFRPFHEHTGSWFWWGKNYCTVEDYKALWQFTINYLRDQKKAHNLLYIYSPDRTQSVEEYMERYPGDEYVDILGLDLYHRGESTEEEYIGVVQNSLEFIKQESVKRNKPFVFSETGLSQLTIPNWFTQVLYKAIEKHRPAYVLVWRNAYEKPDHYYAPYPGHPSCDDFCKFRQLPGILFESEMPNMYK